MSISQISVFLENRAGELATLTSLLAESGINLRAMNIAETGDYGIVRFIADDSSKATAVLEKNDIIFSVTQVMAVEIPDKPGGLNSMLSVLADAGIDISYMYSLFSQKNDIACLILKISDGEKFKKVSAESVIKVLSGEELGIK